VRTDGALAGGKRVGRVKLPFAFRLCLG